MQAQELAALCYDDVQVGDRWTSPARTVTETDIVNFACLSGDFNPLHVDYEFAKNTMFGKPIAHGLLVFSISTGLTNAWPRMRTVAFLSIREWHFRKPVFAGDTVHVVTEVVDKESRGRGRRGSITWRRQIINQAGDVVQEGMTQTLVEMRDAGSEQAGQ